MTSRIPESEIEFRFVRSGGPGGQNVNKVASKAEVRWRVNASAVFSSEDKMRICERLASRISQEGFVIVTAQASRSQMQNRKTAVARLQELVATAVARPKARHATKPSRGAKERRLSEKKRQAEKKERRHRMEE